MKQIEPGAHLAPVAKQFAHLHVPVTIHYTNVSKFYRIMDLSMCLLREKTKQPERKTYSAPFEETGTSIKKVEP